ncbi:MAG TPA: anaerobic ribonucleoside-triphosphate reductase activating protein [Bacilli bacterium]|nr:anaerobic ribonucleoside-triphosphate reductase activating protein [Bacilli bacterium]
MQIRLAAPIQYDSIVDGEGMRAVLWTQGCSHNCKGCHNPMTHDFKGGFLTDTKEVMDELKDNIKYEDGLTLSGGDPFMQADAVCEIASYVQSLGKNVWAYTGFTYEKLIEMSKNNPKIIELLKNVDVLVDGKFVLELKSLDLFYMGSSNQRVIDVKKSLKQNQVVLIEKYNTVKKQTNMRPKEDYMFI